MLEKNGRDRIVDHNLRIMTIHGNRYLFLFILTAAISANAQADDFCAEFGSTPSLNSPFAQIPYVFGRVTIKGLDVAAKFPKVTVTLVDRDQTEKRVSIERKGNYCFRRSGNSTGTLIVEIDGVEAARRSLASFGATQQREDFEVFSDATRSAAPGTVSARFSHPPNDKTADLYRRAANAEKDKDLNGAIRILKEIVALDPGDFIAWAKLGSLHMDRRDYDDAEAAFRRSLVIEPEYLPAWINAGKIRVANKQYEAAIEVFRYAVTLDPTAARSHQLLGEAYLLAKMGTLGAESLNNALRLDPIGMAECHLQLAHLYELAGAKHLAANEYKLFLSKVKDHPDKKKFEKFIKENP